MLAIGAGQEVYRWWLGTSESRPSWFVKQVAAASGSPFNQVGKISLHQRINRHNR